MEGLVPFFATLGLIALLELGDKTQLATISLASHHPRLAVLLGASVGLVLVTAVGVAAGAVIAGVLGEWLVAIKLVGGGLFILAGAWSFGRQESEEPKPPRAGRNAFVTALTANAIAEMGDKTQIAVVILAATTTAPVSVFAGASVGLIAIAITSVLVGAALARALQEQTIRVIATALFVAAGILLIAGALVSG